MGVPMSGKTKDGQEITLRYLEVDPNDRMGLDRAFALHKVEAYVGDEQVGYLKISYVDSKQIPVHFPTIWHWASKTKGWCFDTEDLQSTWFKCHWHIQAIPASLKGVLKSPLQLAKEMAPDETTMHTDLKVLEKVYIYYSQGTVGDMYEDWTRVLVDRPWVDYVRVQESWKRQGIATLMYEGAARWLAEEKGCPLWGSSVQTVDAVATWAFMEAQTSLPVRHADRGDGKILPLIDYTEASP